MRADYLERYHPYLSTDGLRRFRDQGTYYTQARMDHAVTKTSPGHVLIGSGLYPSVSGIIGNEWYDRALHKKVFPTEIVPGGERSQLRWFRGTSFAHRFHRAFPGGHMVSLSMKDRAAFLLGGPGQDGVYWWDAKSHSYLAYGAAPAWLAKFNAQIPAFVKAHRQWDFLADPPDALQATLSANAKICRPAVKPPEYLGLHFPHAVMSSAALMETPYSDELSERLAETVLNEWKLGHTLGQTDVLTVSFSAVDLVGHVYGPDSPEVYDAVIRLDATIAKLMADVNAAVGRDVVWVFTSDHGVTPFPELSRSKGLAAGRVPLSREILPHSEWIESVSDPWIYLNAAAILQAGKRPAEVVEQLQKTIAGWEGVAGVYTLDQLHNGQAPADVLRDYYHPASGEPERCGDLWVVLKPNYIFGGATGTTHGQPTEDDQRIPLGFYGEGIPVAVSNDPVSPAIIAPVLLKRLGISAPDLVAASAFQPQ